MGLITLDLMLCKIKYIKQLLQLTEIKVLSLK